MSFQPILPLSGLAGWGFLSRTKARQEASFNATPVIERDVSHFRKSFPSLTTAKALVDDRQALKVALGAFGLQDDLDNRAFIRKVIEDGTSDRRALANRLADKRYLAFATAFAHLAPDGPAAPEKGVQHRIETAYRSREFEIAVGQQDPSMRMALALQRELPALASDYTSDSARWFAVLGNPPLREVLQTSLGFPKEFGKLDIDAQVSRMQAAAHRKLGTSELTKLAEPDQLERITRDFLVMTQLRDMSSGMSGASIALTLLQQAGPGLRRI